MTFIRDTSRRIDANPQTLAHLRATLAKLERDHGNSATDISELQELIEDLLEAQVREAIADVALSVGEVVRVASQDHVTKANAGAVATAGVAGIIIANVPSGGIAQYTAAGVVVKPGWSLTPGAQYFLSGVTAGGIVTTPDVSAAGTAVVTVGRALEDTESLMVAVMPPMYL